MQASNVRLRRWIWLALGLACVLRLYAIGTELHQSPDTFQYARQAEALRTQGLSAWREEAARFVSDSAMLAVPPVTRTVFLGALAGWMKLTHTSGVESVAAFSCVLDMIAVGLLALLGLELLGEAAAAPAVLLYAVSPAALSLARHGWSDTFGAVFCLLNLLLALRCLRRADERLPQLALGVSLALTFGVKEAPFAQACIVFVTLAVLLVRAGRRADALRVTAAFAVALGAVLAWTALAVGGFARIFAMYGSARDTHAVVPYLVEYQNGTVFDWMHGLWIVDPVVTTLALLGLMLFVVQFRTLALGLRQGLLLCALVCVIFPVLPTFRHQLYNVRFMTPAFAPACVLAAVGLREVWRRITQGTASDAPLAVAAMAVLALVSLWHYQTLIATPDLQDLSLKMILTAHN